jgi:hypothetical protein
MQDRFAQNGLFELVERDAWLDLFEAAPRDCAERFGIKSKQLGEVGLLASREIPIVEFNRAMGVGVSRPATERALEEASAWLQTSAAKGWALQVSPVAQTNLVGDWLHRRAMAPSGTGWAKFERDAAPIRYVRASEVHVRPVNAANSGEFGRVVQAGFGLPAGTATWFAALFGRPGWHLYLAYAGNIPVGSGAAFVRHDLAWLGIDATIADYRRHGAQTALINRRIEDGRAAHLAGFTAETGQPPAGQESAHTSYNNYTRAGFKPAYVRLNYKRP